MKLSVVIPTNMHPATDLIAKGSGIVAVPSKADDTVTLWYEGNLNGACNLHEYRERVICSAGRAQENYPTIAKLALSRQDFKDAFIEVGELVGSIRDRNYDLVIDDIVSVEKWAALYDSAA